MHVVLKTAGSKKGVILFSNYFEKNQNIINIVCLFVSVQYLFAADTSKKEKKYSLP